MARQGFPSDVARSFQDLPSSFEDLREIALASVKSRFNLKFKQDFFARCGYEPYEGTDKWNGQWDIHRCEKRFAFTRYGRRAGKSKAMAMEAAVQAQLPRQVIWIVAPNYELTGRVFREVWRTLVHSLGCKPQTGSSYPKYTLILENETVIQGKTLENEQSLVGEGVNLLIMDEIQMCSDGVWSELLLPAITGAIVRGRCVMIGTPTPGHWTNELYEDIKGRQGTENEDQDWHVFWAPSWANPHMYPGGYDDPEIQLARRQQPPEVFDEQYGARPRRARLQVYREFELSIHVTDVPFNPDLDVILSFDPGTSNGYGVTVAQYDAQNRKLLIIDEFEEPWVINHDVWVALRQRPWWKKVRSAVCDDAQPSERMFWMRTRMSGSNGQEIEGPGIPTFPAFKQRGETSEAWISDGIRLVKKYLRDPQIWDEITSKIAADFSERQFQRPVHELNEIEKDEVNIYLDEVISINEKIRASHVLIDRGCTRTIKEFESYKYQATRTERNLRESPEKKNDHIMDAIRYLVWSKDPAGLKYGARRSPENPHASSERRRPSRNGLPIGPRSSRIIIGV